jgi:hypothetical protein
MRPLPLLCTVPLIAATAPRFTQHTIANDLRGGYQVVAADLNADGRPDLIALGSGMSELVWYENPTWRRHVVVSGLSRMINCVVAGREIVVASGFSNESKNSAGIVSILRPGANPADPWTATEIDRLPTSHRLRAAHIGDGRLIVVNAPLTAPDAFGPEYRGQTPLVYYVPGEWKRRTISIENEGVVHGLFITDWNGDGRDEILTASFTGIHLFTLGKDGRWRRTQLAKGDPAPWPRSGSSDITVGHLGTTRFLAAIEPWHGNQVSVYFERRGKWERTVIDDTLNDGHTIQTADFDGDGNDEIVAGFRGAPRSVYLYAHAGSKWTRTVVDDAGMGAAACVAVDLNADGQMDLACIDATRLKWYENLGMS